MRAQNLIVAMVVAWASIAGATQFRSFDRSAQVRGSDLILLGRVVSVRSFWDESGAAIVTAAEVAIDEVWKGLPHADRIVVRTPGGIVGDIEHAVEGSARFREGESVVLFLNEDGDAYRPWGMTFGKYALEGGRDGEFLVGNLPPAVTGAQRFEAVSIDVDDLHREVRGIIEGEAR